MGQYYNAFGRHEDGTTFNLRASGSLKLMEHSYWENSLCNTVAKELSQSPARLWWVGDYAYECDAYKDCYGSEDETVVVDDPGLCLDGKYIVNLTKRQFLNCSKFAATSSPDDEWWLHPLPLLTAQGNGRGGGDYRGINADKVGIWAGDLLTIVSGPELNKYKDFDEFSIVFYWDC